MKKLIQVLIENIKIESCYKSPDEFISYIKDLLFHYRTESYFVQLKSDSNDDVCLLIYNIREETDEEYQERLKDEKEYKDIRYNQYLSLKEEFE